MPLRNNLIHVLPTTTTSEDLARYIKDDLLSAIEGIRVVELSARRRTGTWLFRIEADENTWSRSARRKKKKKLIVEENTRVLDGTVVHVPSLVCDIHVICSSPEDVALVRDEEADDRGEVGSTSMEIDDIAYNGELNIRSYRDERSSSYSLEFQWLYGKERDLFENFTSHLWTKLRGLVFNNRTRYLAE